MIGHDRIIKRKSINDEALNVTYLLIKRPPLFNEDYSSIGMCGSEISAQPGRAEETGG